MRLRRGRVITMKSTSAAKIDRMSRPLAQVWKWSESFDNTLFLQE
jgi:hypothetical protein